MVILQSVSHFESRAANLPIGINSNDVVRLEHFNQFSFEQLNYNYLWELYNGHEFIMLEFLILILLLYELLLLIFSIKTSFLSFKGSWETLKLFEGFYV